MAGENIDILGIGELKWAIMGELNSDDHYIYYCGTYVTDSRLTIHIKEAISERQANLEYIFPKMKFSSVQSFSRVRLFATT